ncbi:uncharacterized protein VP01_422g2 [Puccinia sorghi]|uniref:Uncharacterized protein n=1 Tax=Puccinia sorghi TaxID=27349 RepID=A0A0L6UQJ2_9BASI|nr:uncharacterized protein VP01_422g2 [Puccinia sorghi]
MDALNARLYKMMRMLAKEQPEPPPQIAPALCPTSSPNSIVLAKPQPFNQTRGAAAESFVGQILLHTITYPDRFPPTLAKCIFPSSTRRRWSLTNSLTISSLFSLTTISNTVLNLHAGVQLTHLNRWMGQHPIDEPLPAHTEGKCPSCHGKIYLLEVDVLEPKALAFFKVIKERIWQSKHQKGLRKKEGLQSFKLVNCIAMVSNRRTGPMRANMVFLLGIDYMKISSFFDAPFICGITFILWGMHPPSPSINYAVDHANFFFLIFYIGHVKFCNSDYSLNFVANDHSITLEILVLVISSSNIHSIGGLAETAESQIKVDFKIL